VSQDTASQLLSERELSCCHATRRRIAVTQTSPGAVDISFQPA
jgi:hypothetical protein